jgi:hypothetical protein
MILSLWMMQQSSRALVPATGEGVKVNATVFSWSCPCGWCNSPLVLLSLLRGERVKVNATVFSWSCPCGWCNSPLVLLSLLRERESRLIRQFSHDLFPVDNTTVFSCSCPCYEGGEGQVWCNSLLGPGWSTWATFFKRHMHEYPTPCHVYQLTVYPQLEMMSGMVWLATAHKRHFVSLLPAAHSSKWSVPGTFIVAISVAICKDFRLLFAHKLLKGPFTPGVSPGLYLILTAISNSYLCGNAFWC